MLEIFMRARTCFIILYNNDPPLRMQVFLRHAINQAVPFRRATLWPICLTSIINR